MRILMKVSKAKVPNLSKALKSLPKKSSGEFAKILARLKLLEKSSSVGEKPTSKVAFPGVRDDPPLGVKGASIAKEGIEEPKVEIRESVPSEKGRTDLPDEGKILESRRSTYIDPKEQGMVIHLDNRETAKNGDETSKGSFSFKEDLKKVAKRPESTAFSKSSEVNEIPEGIRVESKHRKTEDSPNNAERRDFRSSGMVRDGAYQKTSKSRKVIGGTHKLKEISMETVEYGKSGGEVHDHKEKRTKSQETRGRDGSFSKTSQSEIKRDPAAERKPSEEVSEVSKENTEIFEDESGNFKRSSHLEGPKAHGERQPKKFEHVERENVESLQEVPRRTISKTPKSGIGDRWKHRTETPKGSMKSNGFQGTEFRMAEKEKRSTEFERLESRGQSLPKDSKVSGKTSKEVILEEKTSGYKKDSQKTVRKERADGSHRSIFRSASERGSDGKQAEYEEHLKMDTSENNAYEESLKGKTVVSKIFLENEERKSEKPFKAFDGIKKNSPIKRVSIIGDQSSPIGKMSGEEMIKTPPHADGNTAEVIKESAGSVFKKTKKLKIERLEKSTPRTANSSERTAGSVFGMPASRRIDSIEVDDQPPEANPHAVLAKILKREKPMRIERGKRHANEQLEKADHWQVNEVLSPEMAISTARLNVESDLRKLGSPAEKRPLNGEMGKFLDDVKVESQFPERRKKEKILKVEKLEIVIEKKVRKAYGRVERGNFDEVFERVREMRRELEGVKTLALDKNSGKVESAKVSVDEMIERIHRIVESLKTKPVATERARMELIPPDLGKVEVEIVKKGDELSVFFKASTDEAKDLIERRIEILSHRLSNDGFNVEKIEVRLERENEDELPEREEEKGQQRENHENEKKRKRREGEER